MMYSLIDNLWSLKQQDAQVYSNNARQLIAQCQVLFQNIQQHQKSLQLKQLMISSFTIAKHLLFRVQYFTAKSRRQTTPNLIKNPTLSQRGIIKPPGRSYAYNLPEDLANRHLYWNNTVQNKIRRKEYHAHRLYKMGIKPIHSQKGQLLFNRSKQQILYELSNLKLLKQSIGRALINLRQIAVRHPQTLKTSDKDIVYWALEQLNQRNLGSMSRYDFSTYCYLRCLLKAKPTASILVHTYKWIEAEVESPTGRLKPEFFLDNLKYVFSQSYPDEYNDILYKKQIEFKMFEDVQPTNKPLEQLLPKLFSEVELQNLKATKGFTLQSYKFLMTVPGGKKFYDRLQAA